MNDLLNKVVADRNTIAAAFNTCPLTTHRILQNLSYGFFRSHFADYERAWNDAHPFKYTSGNSINYTEIDINFIKKHFDIFAGKQFWTGAGWTYNESIGKMDWRYTSGYTDVQPIFNNN